MDAGPNGLGLILMQEKPEGWKAAECASRSLTEVEKRYSQIDREALAIRWACERCYLYLTGSSFGIETDHQPLLTLFNNSHSRPPMRTELWLLCLQQFDFQLKYCPEARMVLTTSQGTWSLLLRVTLKPVMPGNRSCTVSSQIQHRKPSH